MASSRDRDRRAPEHGTHRDNKNFKGNVASQGSPRRSAEATTKERLVRRESHHPTPPVGKAGVKEENV
jgi:hypothetical protein